MLNFRKRITREMCNRFTKAIVDKGVVDLIKGWFVCPNSKATRRRTQQVRCNRGVV